MTPDRRLITNNACVWKSLHCRTLAQWNIYKCVDYLTWAKFRLKIGWFQLNIQESNVRFFVGYACFFYFHISFHHNFTGFTLAKYFGRMLAYKGISWLICMCLHLQTWVNLPLLLLFKVKVDFEVIFYLEISKCLWRHAHVCIIIKWLFIVNALQMIIIQ